MHTYKNGNYYVTIFNDGTKIRRTNDNEFIPSFSENTDCTITRKCSQNCSFCYEWCNINGKHGDLFKFNFINTIHPYTEIALNGNDLDHPDLEKFLVFLKNKKVFANITVNQFQFLNNIEKLKKWQENKLIYGIGVSLQKVTDIFIEKIKLLDNIVLHTIVGILSEDDILKLKDNNLKILILGYKKTGRGNQYLNNNIDLYNINKEYLYNNIDKFKNWFNVVSFDNLAIEELDIRRLLSIDEWEEFYMGDDGNFTFYIDMVEGVFAKNSISEIKYPIENKTIDEMFNIIINNN